MRQDKEYNVEGGLGLAVRRLIAYIVLIILSILCLFWFYILFVNASRAHSDLARGFTLIPGTYLLKNWEGVMNGTQPIANGMLNSFIIAACASVLCVYFSTMTAYAIHVYDFKAKKAIFTFILAVMMIPTQVTALGFIKLVQGIKLENSFIPLIIPTIAAPATFYYMKQYMESALPHAIVEAARIDGASPVQQFRHITMPYMLFVTGPYLLTSFTGNIKRSFPNSLYGVWRIVPTAG